MAQVSLKDFERALYKRKISDHRCKDCGGRVSYSIVEGSYTCQECGSVEKDNYGKIKDMLERNPALSRIELVSILHIPMRELNRYFVDGVLTNPRDSLLG